MRNIYLDNAASTPIDKRVKREILRSQKIFGNPSSFNNIGRKSHQELSKARLKIARFLGSHSDEIIFTSSATEANNLAILGLFSRIKRGEIITTSIEHPSVLGPVKFLGKKGLEIQYLNLDDQGIVDIQDLEKKISKKTILVSVMYANNEIGSIQPIVKISKLIKEFRAKNKSKFPILHVDACQAIEYLDSNVNHLGADLFVFNGIKIYGPRGIGVLYIRRGIPISPIIYGGGQENGSRSGTENLPAICGLAKAIEITDKKESKRLSSLRDYFIYKIGKGFPDWRINGPLGKERLPNNINISIPSMESEIMLLELDKYGIYAGSGSACTSKAVEPSHVLKAIKNAPEYLNGVLRFSMGRETKKRDMDYLLKVLLKIISNLKKRYRR